MDFERPEGRENLKKEIAVIQEGYEKLRSNISKAVVGQKEVLDALIISLMADGHILLEGVPGLAKSLLVEALGRSVSGTTFRRIQFVPDMLPADILGMNVFHPVKGEFYIVKGPIFANFILADEINRAPPKTQAALMEVMQERKVNIQKEEFVLEKPFLVLATENPLEQYGVYPLPEAIIDRFLMKIIVDYPKEEEEIEIVDQNTMVRRDLLNEINPIIDKDFIIKSQEVVREIYMSPKLKKYIVDIVNTTRGKTNYKISDLKYIRWGASPRASITLGLTARANALLHGRDYVLPSDIKFVAKPVLRHRIILNYEGKASGISVDKIIEDIIETVEVI
jgi:MoxR-like ATPase